MANLLLPIKDAKKSAAIKALSLKGTIRAAVSAAKISWPTHYNWLKSDPDYAEAVEIAKHVYADTLEEEMHRRAVKGVTKGIYYRGQMIDTEQEYSDTLLIVALKGARPEKYKDNPQGIGQVIIPVQINITQKAKDAL